ncbi:MAG: CPBP family intramembrane metalloprotease [Proteobacteria bacterium]|nr:CPBP family intramembrane metalloprotease [Pseudomonadota bacterium]
MTNLGLPVAIGGRGIPETALSAIIFQSENYGLPIWKIMALTFQVGKSKGADSMSLQVVPSIVLTAMVIGLAWATNRSRQSAEAFKLIDDSARRRAALRRRGLRSFLMFFIGGVAVLLALGRLSNIFALPPEFSHLRTQLGIEPDDLASNPDRLAGMLLGLTMAGVLVLLVWRYVFRKRSQPIIGDVTALMPRNRAEVWTMVPLALNAGIGEELFFRLALPLTATLATESAHFGTRFACVAFGLSHWYQGWKGVALTMLAALFFMRLYLATGSLLVPMMIHAAIDLLGLVVRPAISLWLDRKGEALAA